MPTSQPASRDEAPAPAPLSRARFLRISAIAAAGTLVAACQGGAQPSTAGTSSAVGTTAGGAASSTASPSSAATSAVGSTASGSSAPSVSATTESASASAAAASTSASSATVTTSAESAAATTSAGSTSAATSVASTAAGTGFAVATPAAFQGPLKEAPALADLAKAGKLPPVAQRLPEHPYVVPHQWLSPGQYGGTMRWVVSDKSDWGTTHHIQESMYGHSPLRWLKDALEIGPGLAESWEANADQSVWTFHFRKGLKWSDGQPWTVADILFWWDDEVHVSELNELPPDELRSGKGTLAQLKQVDDTTLQVIFDAPTPLLAERLANWVNRGIGSPRFMDCKHYMQQFHIKYNPGLDKTKWVTTFQAKQDWATNPDNPTMTGWKLKSYAKGQNSVWERNPYYWCVDKAGNQLPYLDGITVTNLQDPQVMRLQIQQGTADFVHGGFVGLNLGDVSSFKQTQAASKMDVRFWDSGSGTASCMFFNYDYYEPKMRQLIREPKFRQALSLAFNRKQAQKAIYFDTGEITTGTYSSKTIEFHIGAQGPQMYKDWRDSFAPYDPERAKQMLDALGVKLNGQFRTLPDGSPLKVTLDYPADQDPSGEHVKKNELLAKDWQTIGVDAVLNPVTPASFHEQWAAGKVMTTTAWENSGSPEVVISVLWMMPVEPTRWAPLEGTYWTVLGTPKEHAEQDVDPYKRTPPRMAPESGGPVDRLWKLYQQARVELDAVKRNSLVWDMMKIQITDGPFVQGTVADYPQIELVKSGLKNVPMRDDLAQHGYVNDWEHPTPAAYDPEAWYWDNPAAHR